MKYKERIMKIGQRTVRINDLKEKRLAELEAIGERKLLDDPRERLRARMIALACLEQAEYEDYLEFYQKPTEEE
jgi:hypothetical protein